MKTTRFLPLSLALLALAAAACGPKSSGSSPAPADLLVLTQPPGPLAGVAGSLYGIDLSKPATEAVSASALYQTGKTPNAMILQGGEIWVADSSDAKVEVLTFVRQNGLVELAPAASPAVLEPGSYPEFLSPAPDGSVLVTLGAYPGRTSGQLAQLGASPVALKGYLNLTTASVMSWGIASEGGRTAVADTGALAGMPGIYLLDGQNQGTGTLPVATTAPSGVAFDGSNRLVVTEEGDFLGDGLVEVFDLARNVSTLQVPVLGSPAQVAVAGHRVYASDASSLTLWIIDLSELHPQAQPIRLPPPAGCSTSAGFCYSSGVHVDGAGHVWVCAWEKIGLTANMGQVFETDPEGAILNTYTIPEAAQDLVFLP